MGLKRLIGSREFYRRVMVVVIPIIIQNAITNFVSLLDNIMIGQVGTVQMSGVAIVNQLIFVFNLCVFGAASGAGIFTAQYFGSRDDQGVRYTFRFKLLIALFLASLGTAIFLLGGRTLIGLYLRGEQDPSQAALTMAYGKDYLQVMLLGLLPFALSNAYSSTLREGGETKIPMIGGVAAVLVNLLFNYLLIFGHLGFPVMGVRGAALATVLSRFVELAIVAGWTHLHRQKNPFIVGAYRSMYMPLSLFNRIIVKGMPLLINEALWALGTALNNQCYSIRGLDVVAAMNIASTLWNVSSVVFLSMGNAVGILIGQMLGAGLPEAEVRDSDTKMIAISVVSCGIFGSLMAAFSRIFPQIYNTTEDIRFLAGNLILVGAVMMPFEAYCHSAYFTLRSGGQTMVTFLFDSCFVWAVSVPVAFCLSRFTSMSILPMFIICSSTTLIKCVIGYAMIRRGTWIRNLAAGEQTAP